MDQILGSLGLGLPQHVTAVRESQRLRLATMVRLRWLSIAGQLAACVFVAWGLWYPYPVHACLALIALSAGLNLVLRLTFAESRRISSSAAAGLLAFDIVQLAGLLYLTGGIQNPFAVFLIVPAVIAAATQPPLSMVALGILSALIATLVSFFHLPLPWHEHSTLLLPHFYVGGLWFAIVITLLFLMVYIYRVAAEARSLADALAATELTLQREQHLSALDGLAAAAAHELGTPLATIALVVKELDRLTAPGDAIREDVDLLVAQSQRCRDILRRLTTLSADGEEHLARLPLMSLIEEVSEPHRDFGVAIDVVVDYRDGPEPVMRRNPGVLYGIGNLVENAVDFAKSQVIIVATWTSSTVRIRILDDGPGYASDVLARIGDPYMADRERTARKAGGGLGLGLFIAKALLERSGATLAFANRREKGTTGAVVEVSWSHETFTSSRTNPTDPTGWAA
ncbi:ActS/PrrB/RegB family redox-sensitive histidine kinase [Aurantimonas sp. MSK8Z-1]|uniref:ActS/PrrB/RegB family redox-sensitive histidine kinase n=1 Tax=Mangrovibrevibacter kandeliae TaxID=2968473 RepID=UPI0021176D3E|nr:ActS/PrrB/RegB family redox-sensitive histidine kinase [Aurantimonas sp. MSK8Z-1]MCW4115091.1 ActS/PrrB/RegB family redox-sensitive histidine kinase [Aurantimonas sp. MSK8Z-1]